MNKRIVELNNIGEYKYINEKEFPLFVIGVVKFKNDDRDLNFFNFKEVTLNNVSHQISGLLCNQVYIYGYAFTPIDLEYYNLANKLYKNYYGSNICDNVNLTEIIKYNNILKEYNLNCESSFLYFKEAIYPIDGNNDILQKIVGISFDEFVKKYVYFNEVNKKNTEFLYSMWLKNVLNIYILTNNSD